MYFMKMIIRTIITDNSTIKNTVNPAPPTVTIDEVSVVKRGNNKKSLYYKTYFLVLK